MTDCRHGAPGPPAGQAHRAPGLYLHIPFCRSRCAYCDFYSTTDASLVPAFLEALPVEMGLYREAFEPFDTIYLGGGTPSLLDPRQVETLLERIRGSFSILPGAEITMEANPADLGVEELRELKTAGVNRLTLGIQSFRDEELSLLGRRHDRAQALAAVEAARTAGFDNLCLDLIYGLPGQSVEHWLFSLRQAVELRPAHLSCYELELKPCTPLGRLHAEGKIEAASEDTARELFVRTSEVLVAAGYVHYEVSNFAAGMHLASRHNRKYWDHTPFLGLGPGAHSMRGNRRWWNRSCLRAYLDDLREGRLPVEGSEELDTGELAMEALFLGLRTKEGIDLEEYRLRYGRDLLREHGRELQKWREEGLVELSGPRLRPTLPGMAVADALALL